MFVPQNEQGVIVLFSSMAKEAGWEFVEVTPLSFPDAILKRGEEVWRVEFEFVASNFLDHKHDHRQCDMIICWRNDYRECPLPIIELENDGWLGQEYRQADQKDVEIEYWKCRAIRTENQVKRLKSQGVAETIEQPKLVDDDDDRKIKAFELIEKGISHIAIATELGVHRNTISTWRKTMNKA